MGRASHLTCGRCAKTFTSSDTVNLCDCGDPPLVNYDLPAIRNQWRKDDLRTAVNSMWRYAPVLPADLTEAVTIEEGWTPLMRANRLGRECGARNLWIKDESRNPSYSFQARGFSCAVTMAKKLGIGKLAVSSAGDAGSALAAYAAAAGLAAHIFMPREVPEPNFVECKALGANVTVAVVPGRKQREGGVEVAAPQEPYRIEGMKTMGYEIAEQLNWELPDAILHPCGGVGQIGMWKAFSELEQLGWIGNKRPKIIAVQAACGQSFVQAFEKTMTLIEIPKDEMMDAALLLARSQGIFPAPKAGACVAAAKRLLGSGYLSPDDRIVLVNTGSGLKYLNAYATRFPRQGASEQDKLGGLITPR